jgi:hypothetical protein
MFFHLLKGIPPYPGLLLFLPSGTVIPQIARILKTTGSEIGSADNSIKQ